MQIEVTDKAYEALIKIKRGAKPEDKYCRILLKTSSCHGTIFGAHFEQKRDEDICLTYREIDFIIQPKLLQQYEGFTLDYEQFFMMGRLSITPQKEYHECSCGKGQEKE